MTKWLNQNWLSFYWRAETIYQIHSPFLFDFATNLWPQINSDPNFNRDKPAKLETTVTTWINHLCRYYRMEQLIISSNSNLVHSFKNNDTTLPSGDNPSLMDQLIRYHVNKANHNFRNDQSKPVIDVIGVFSVATLLESDLKSILAINDSCLILCYDIHSSRTQYLQWKEILARPEFSFSVELYNFGLLFKHPVNQQPEHITLISWHQKPWKIKIL